MRKPRVLLDADGVVIDFANPAIKAMEKITGKPVPDDVLEDWDMFRSYDKETQGKFYKEFNREGWCLDLPVYPGAQEGVEMLRQLADVYFVTSPMFGPHWAYERSLSLIRNFGAKNNQIIHTNAKYICVGDVLVDDKTDHVVKWSLNHPKGHALLWDQPYNRKHEGSVRVKSWLEVRAVVSAVAA